VTVTWSLVNLPGLSGWWSWDWWRYAALISAALAPAPTPSIWWKISKAASWASLRCAAADGLQRACLALSCLCFCSVCASMCWRPACLGSDKLKWKAEYCPIIGWIQIIFSDHWLHESWCCSNHFIYLSYLVDKTINLWWKPHEAWDQIHMTIFMVLPEHLLWTSVHEETYHMSCHRAIGVKLNLYQQQHRSIVCQQPPWYLLRCPFQSDTFCWNVCHASCLIQSLNQERRRGGLFKPVCRSYVNYDLLKHPRDISKDQLLQICIDNKSIKFAWNMVAILPPH